jgi:hypothetical protein
VENDLKHLFFFIAFLVTLGFAYGVLHAQPPVSSTVFPEALERDDFPPSTPVDGQPTIFKTALSTRSSLAIVYRNGLLQRACVAGQAPAPNLCDYNVSGNVIVTYPGSGTAAIQMGDLVTLFFNR